MSGDVRNGNELEIDGLFVGVRVGLLIEDQEDNCLCFAKAFKAEIALDHCSLKCA